MSQARLLTAARAIAVAAVVTIVAAVTGFAPSRADEVPENIRNAPGIASAADKFPLGAQIYKTRCAACHEYGGGRAPARIVLNNVPPEGIRDALTTGAMKAQGARLSEEEKVAVAQFLAGREIGTAESSPPPRMCKGKRAVFDLSQPPAFSGWGFDPESTHGLSTARAGIGRANVATLKLKWAFGFPGANRSRSQPAIGGGAIFVGSQDGKVYALDSETGCARWIFEATAEVRTGIVLSPWQAGDADAAPLAYFGDWAGNAYAVEALTGKLFWKVNTDDHPATVITATPALHGDTLFVPVSSLEEASAASPDYLCCTFRGSVLALDAATGAIRWRTYMVGEPVRHKSGDPKLNDYYGPSGVAVWTTPAIDEKRGVIYVTTGDNYSNPATELSDAILALDMNSGAIKWHYQATEGDAYNVACILPDSPNCPEDAGPDFDFGAGPALARGDDGREYLLAGQKSGVAYALDPETGKLLWQQRLGRGGEAGGIHFGIAAVAGRVFVPVSDLNDSGTYAHPASPGVYGLDIASGKRLWSAPSPESCNGRRLCVPGYGGAVTATPELVFAGSDDGHMRIFDSATGEALWDYQTAREFETVNGVKGMGGAISGSAAPIAFNRMLIVGSGYGFVSKMPGNVLLVFEAR